MKKAIKTILMTLLTITSLFSLFAWTFSWFAITVKINDINGGGTVKEAYFAYGSGTESDPYGITTPRHLYNLAWLQYNGQFNKVSNGSCVQKYFKVANRDENGVYTAVNIDMSTYVDGTNTQIVLPPIGTTEYPFLGSFDGEDSSGNISTISKLKISNPTSFSAKPNNIEYDEENPPEIVGFFGVVGDYGNLTYAYNSSANQITNIILDDINVKSETTKTLIGLAAGYINAKMSGVRLTGEAVIDVNGQTSTALPNGATSNLSDYGLVGYSENLDGTATYAQKLSRYYCNNESGSSGSGEDSEWGGSFNSKDYDVWIYNLKTAGSITGSGSAASPYSYSVSGEGGYSLKYTASSISNPSSNQVVNRLRDGTYLPLKFTENKNAADLSNTGYIAGVNIGTGVNGSPKISSYNLRNIGNSLGNTAFGTDNYYDTYNSSTTVSFSDSAVEVLTYSFVDSSWYRIKDSHNSGNTTTNTVMTEYTKDDDTTPENLGFEKYNASRDTLTSILNSGNQIHGIKFDTQLDQNSVTTIPANTARINGDAIDGDYPVPKGAVDFSLKKTGFVNFFAGAYNSGGLGDNKLKNINFFSIYEIKRNNNHTINTITEISKVYRNKYWDSNSLSDSVDNPKYFYQYNTSPSATYSNIKVNGVIRAATLADRDTSVGNDGLEFDIRSILGDTTPARNCLYYFEIPINDGEYALGSVNGSSDQGAYLIYLDIGANGDTINIDTVSAYTITTINKGSKFPSGVDFAPVDVTGDGGDSIGVYIASGKKGIIKFLITQEDVSHSIAGNIMITDASSISSYSFQGNKYASEGPPDEGDFTVSGNSPGALPSQTSDGGERILQIHLKKVDETELDIRVTDTLANDGSTITSSKYELKTGSNYVTTVIENVLNKTDQINTLEKLNALRNLQIVAVLTRASGSTEFHTTYDEENSSYNNKIVDVDIERNGTTISIAVTAGYTFRIGGTRYLDGSTYPAS